MGEIVITKWSPDTCKCVLNYSWLRDSDENERVHVFHSVDKVCHDHEHLKGTVVGESHIQGIPQDVNSDHLGTYQSVLEENQRKNILLQHALDAHPSKLAHQIVNKKTGAVTNVKQDDVEYTFFFTGTAPHRILNVTFSEELTDAEKRLVEARFPEKVKVL